MVHIAGSLPRTTADGATAHTQALVDALVSGEKFMLVGMVTTDSVKTSAKDLRPDPTIKFLALELVSSDDYAMFARLLDCMDILRGFRTGEREQQLHLDDSDPDWAVDDTPESREGAVQDA